MINLEKDKFGTLNSMIAMILIDGNEEFCRTKNFEDAGTFVLSDIDNAKRSIRVQDEDGTRYLVLNDGAKDVLSISVCETPEKKLA